MCLDSRDIAVRFQFLIAIDHLLCTDPGVILMKKYINEVTLKGLIQYLVTIPHQGIVFKILSIILHTFQTYKRDEVMYMLGANHNVREP